MEILDTREVAEVSGACAEHCWGDMSWGAFAGSVVGGAIGGAGGGPIGASLGAIGGGASYFFSKAWD